MIYKLNEKKKKKDWYILEIYSENEIVSLIKTKASFKGKIRLSDRFIERKNSRGFLVLAEKRKQEDNSEDASDLLSWHKFTRWRGRVRDCWRSENVWEFYFSSRGRVPRA